ncbi:hypothetical protein IFM89_033063 [Coptis chinensis]|uniref:Uncharacterized protein n=1 Tax=Coptis chinensis TaxID=261450 RepID=A0A835IJV9_9MAGN|nr:hypothetical protein IFM89_033063 [Coptis chinensis]
MDYKFPRLPATRTVNIFGLYVGKVEYICLSIVFGAWTMYNADITTGNLHKQMKKYIQRIVSSVCLKGGLFIESLKEASRDHVEVDLSAKVLTLSTDMSCLMVFGKKRIHNEHEQKGFHAVVQEGMQLATVFNIVDYILYVGALDLQGLAKRMKVVSKVFDDMFEQIIDEHVDAGDKGQH